MEIDRLNQLLRDKQQEIDDWASRYADLEREYNSAKAQFQSDLDRLNGLLRDRDNEINRLKTDLFNT